MRPICILLLLLTSVTAWAQPNEADTTVVDSLSEDFLTYRADREAKEAVYMIVRYSGLTPNFVLKQEDVKSAVAYIKGKKRYIGYNPSFIARVRNTANTDWAAVSVLAHEIGHHLLGHTLTTKHSPGDELAADRYSGFILYLMGASLEESKAAMEVAGSKTGTKKHPPKTSRLQAIANGWFEAHKLSGKRAMDSTLVAEDDPRYIMQLEFMDDEQIYYVTEDNRVMWFDNFAKPIMIGHITTSNDDNYAWQYHYLKESFGIDFNGDVWNMTTYGAVFKVGEAIKLVHPNPEDN